MRLSVKSGTGCTPQGPELKLHIKSKNREKQQRLRISTRIACNNAHINININILQPYQQLLFIPV